MFKFIKNKEVILFAVFVSVLIPVSGVLAAIELRMQTNWPPTPTGHTLNVGSTITDLVRYFYEWGITLGGLAAFVALIIAGFLYLTSVGDPGKMKDAIDRIKSAFFGLVLLLGSFLVLHTINPELTVLREIVFRPEDVPRVDLPGARLLAPPNPCVKAMLFREPNFKGDYFEMIPGDQKSFLRFEPRSFKFCREMIGGETRSPGDRCEEIGLIEGGACTLQLFEGGWFLGWGCGGPVVELSGPRVANIANIMGVERIKCLELVATVVPVAPPDLKPGYAFLSHRVFQGDHDCDTYPANCCPANYVMCALAGLERHILAGTIRGEGWGWVHGKAFECWDYMTGNWTDTLGMHPGTTGTIRSHIPGDPAKENRCDARNRVWCCP